MQMARHVVQTVFVFCLPAEISCRRQIIISVCREISVIVKITFSCFIRPIIKIICQARAFNKYVQSCCNYWEPSYHMSGQRFFQQPFCKICRFYNAAFNMYITKFVIKDNQVRIQLWVYLFVGVLSVTTVIL